MILEYIGTSWVSRIIRLWCYRKYSHASWTFAEIQGGELKGNLSEYESWTTNGVCRVDMIGKNHTPGIRIDLYDLREKLTQDELEKGVPFLLAQIGKGYDWMGIFSFAFRTPRVESPDRWFCSEYVFEFLRTCGRTILQNMEPYQVSPGDIATSTELVYRGYIIAGTKPIVHQDGQDAQGNQFPPLSDILQPA